jgi:hypothetical protein
VVPAGGFSFDHTRWIRPRYRFFLPIKVLSRVFRGKDGSVVAFQRNRCGHLIFCVSDAALGWKSTSPA